MAQQIVYAFSFMRFLWLHPWSASHIPMQAHHYHLSERGTKEKVIGIVA